MQRSNVRPNYPAVAVVVASKPFHPDLTVAWPSPMPKSIIVYQTAPSANVSRICCTRTFA